MRTVARYIDDFGVKISILPSSFNRVDADATKRAQFFEVGQPKIRNRVVQFLVGETFITTAPDEAIYGNSYPDTNRKLEEFEELARTRGKEGKHTAGYIPLYSAFTRDIRMGDDPSGTSQNWKNRVSHYCTPFQYSGAPVHDFQISVFEEGRWTPITTRSGHYINLDFKADWEFKIDLKILHYNTLFRLNQESVEFVPRRREDIANLGEHPKHYIEKMLS